MKKQRLLLIALVLVAGAGAGAPAVARDEPPLDGRGRIVKDDLLDHLAGKWDLTRKIRGKSARNSVDAEWVLGHQFLEIHMTDAATPPEYEAKIFIGYDNASERYVAHWIDVFGGRFSETLGFGRRDGNSIRFVFEYPDGPFHNTFRWDPAANGWTCLLEQKDGAGRWTVFAEDTLRRPEK
ncbi:MAG: DUF1579 family protein [Acidobacteria bacterium]|nr:DUF1579 family protein [Acidobacteriota bacterium]